MENKPSLDWKEKLKNNDYTHSCRSTVELHQQAKLGRSWRKVLAETGLKPPAKVLEIGSGGGQHVVALALNGFQVTGIDISPDVVMRSKNYINEVNSYLKEKINPNIMEANIFSFETEVRFDLTYHFGVVEHFLDSNDRKRFWDKMVRFTKPGGWVLSAVPNGSHYWRDKIRRENLCGYDIAEIDYSVTSHEAEFHNAGLIEVRAIPWNYFAFLFGVVQKQWAKPLIKGIFLASNLFLPSLPLVPQTYKEKFAHNLLVIGRKP